MKSLQKTLLSAMVLLISSISFGQKIRVKDGDKTVLKNENAINIEFTFDNVRVGKYNKEDDYMAAKKEEYNKKETGRGDTWASRWKDDQQTRFPADFTSLFTKNANMTTAKDAKYTMIVHTTFIEPGFYTPIAFVRKYANINAEISIVETANKHNTVASFTIENSPGRSAIDIADFDTGQRISEAYAKAGKEMGKYLK